MSDHQWDFVESTISHCPNAIRRRLDISQSEVAEYQLWLNAGLIRNGFLRKDELCSRERFETPYLGVDGPPYSSKTSHARAMKRLRAKGANQPELPGYYHTLMSHRLVELISNTDRPIRTDYGVLSESQGDPYFFYGQDDAAALYRTLLCDKASYERRIAGNLDYRRQHYHWAFFGGVPGEGHLYSMPFTRLRRAGQGDNVLLFREGSVEPVEAEMTYYYRSLEVFFEPLWHRPKGELDEWITDPDREIVTILSAHRLNQSARERDWRLTYGIALTNWILDDCETDYVFHVGSENSTFKLATKLFAELYDTLVHDQQINLLLSSLRNFIERHADEIEKRAWSNDYEQYQPLGRLAAFLNRTRLVQEGYRFYSILSGPELDIPLSEAALKGPIKLDHSKELMLTICRHCRTQNPIQFLDGNQVKFRCTSCGVVDGQILMVDGKILVERTDRGIEHVSAAALIERQTDGGEKEILLLHRRTHPFGWACTVGHQEVEDEDVYATVDRETREETGLIVATKERIGDFDLPVSECRAGSDVEHWAVFRVECTESPDAEQITLNDENDKAEWVPVSKLGTLEEMTVPTRYVLCRLGYIDDPKFVTEQEERRTHSRPNIAER